MEAVVERLAGPVPADAGQFRTLFHEHVVANPDPNQDDLLFFVRKRYERRDATGGDCEGSRGSSPPVGTPFSLRFDRG